MPDSINPYDVNLIMADMEQDLIANYKRNLLRHTQEEAKEGFQWAMWQQIKLQDIRQYQEDNKKIVQKYVRKVVGIIQSQTKGSFRDSASGVDSLLSGQLTAAVTNIDDFFKANHYQVEALINAVKKDFTDASRSVLRLTDDVYRQTIFKSHLYYTTGTDTLWKAVDRASQDFLNAGINSIEYKNGNRVNISSYSEMYLRTSSKRAALVGEGRRQAEWGVNLVQISSYGACSRICLPWQGRVYIDDVYADGENDGRYPLLSSAISGGLFHPNCRHRKMPYFEGISYPPAEYFDKETIQKNYKAQERQRKIERNIRRYKRKAAGSLDPQNQKEAYQKVIQWQDKLKEHVAENSQLRRIGAREQVEGFGSRQASLAAWQEQHRYVDENKKYLGTSAYKETVDKLKDIEYNNNKWLFDGYKKAVDKGDIHALTGFDNYVETAKQIEKELVGITTQNGIEIKGYTTHFVGRVIGQISADDADKSRIRKGVQISDIKGALMNPDKIDKAKTRDDGKRSIVFTGSGCKVSVNPDTQMLVQTNPIGKKGKK